MVNIVEIKSPFMLIIHWKFILNLICIKAAGKKGVNWIINFKHIHNKIDGFVD